MVEFGRLTRSRLERCFEYIDKPAEFGSDLASFARKLLLTMYSIRTIQIFDLKFSATQADSHLLVQSEKLMKKHSEPYVEAVSILLKARRFIGEPEKAEQLLEDSFERTGTGRGRNPENPAHTGRFSAALGDLRVERAQYRWRLKRGDEPDMLLSDWQPLSPDAPSTLERNVKWWRDRTVGGYFTERGRFKGAEDILRRHVAEFAAVDMEATTSTSRGAMSSRSRTWPTRAGSAPRRRSRDRSRRPSRSSARWRRGTSCTHTCC